MSTSDGHQPQVTTLQHDLTPTTTPPPLTPAAASQDTDSDPDLTIATLVSATFAPMPGYTDGPKLWEAAGLLGKNPFTPVLHNQKQLLSFKDQLYSLQ